MQAVPPHAQGAGESGAVQPQPSAPCSSRPTSCPGSPLWRSRCTSSTTAAHKREIRPQAFKAAMAMTASCSQWWLVLSPNQHCTACAAGTCSCPYALSIQIKTNRLTLSQLAVISFILAAWLLLAGGTVCGVGCNGHLCTAGNRIRFSVNVHALLVGKPRQTLSFTAKSAPQLLTHSERYRRHDASPSPARTRTSSSLGRSSGPYSTASCCGSAAAGCSPSCGGS